ncbi:hypothetical protein EJ06DRAFT_464715, partial [Trichodelitschia bisporula]
MVQGTLYVSSATLDETKLPPSKFVTWYENIHVDEVVDLPGVPAATRYEAIPLHQLTDPRAAAPSTPTEPPSWLAFGGWLTLYEFNDIAYRKTDEFLALDGQSEPKPELLNSVFKNAWFNTRFMGAVQVDENPASALNAPYHAARRPAPLVITAFIQPKDEAHAAEIDKWYRAEHVPLLSKVRGYVRTR